MLLSIVCPATAGPQNGVVPYFHSTIGVKLPFCWAITQASLSGTSSTGTSGMLQNSPPVSGPTVVVPSVSPGPVLVVVPLFDSESGPLLGSPLVLSVSLVVGTV